MLEVAMQQRGCQPFVLDLDQPMYFEGYLPVAGRVALQGASESDPLAGRPVV